MITKLAKEIETRIDEEMSFYQTPGIVLGVGHVGNDFLYLTKGVKKTGGKKLSVDDPMPFGSISKLYTAVLCMVLESKKILNLADPVSKYLNVDWKGKEDKISLAMLLTNHSGLCFTRDHYSWDEEKFVIMDDNLFDSEPNENYSEPNENYSESEVAYQVLSLILEKATNKPLSKIYDEHLFAPTGLTSSFGECKNPSVAGHAPQKLPEIYHAPLKVLPPFNYTGADGGIMSSIKDLCRFGELVVQGIFGEGPFSDAKLDRLKEHLGERGEKSFYSYGCYVKELSFGSLLGHGGDLNGYQAGLYFNLEKKVVVGLLSNGPGYPYGVCEAILDAVVSEDANKLKQSSPKKIDSPQPFKLEFNSGELIFDLKNLKVIEGESEYKVQALSENCWVTEHPLLRPFLLNYNKEKEIIDAGPFQINKYSITCNHDEVAVYANSSPFPPEYLLLYKNDEKTMLMDPGSICYSGYEFGYQNSNEPLPESVENSGTIFNRVKYFKASELKDGWPLFMD